MDVGQVGIAGCGLFIPIEHGVDGLRQFSTASFINTTCVDPDIVKATAQCFFAATLDLIRVVVVSPFRDVFEKHLILAPSM